MGICFVLIVEFPLFYPTFDFLNSGICKRRATERHELVGIGFHRTDYRIGVGRNGSVRTEVVAARSIALVVATDAIGLNDGHDISRKGNGGVALLVNRRDFLSCTRKKCD